ncbi:MAG: hypothetical protein ABJ263_10260 [Tateyamaria sp.]|uniref:WD40 repeat domain-containing protein n=1 Tax=Tateyamaria sp. TaxID=1929288 RepID=UPI0032795D82
MTQLDTIDQGIVRVAPGTECHEVTVGANVTALCVAQSGAFFGLGDGRVMRLKNGETTTLWQHESVVTALSVGADEAPVSAGQDGRVCVDGKDVLSGKDDWITCLCHNADKTRFAVAYGKRVEVIAEGKVVARLDDLPSTVTGIQFFGAGERIAISHYNGVSLWEYAQLARPVVLTWRGSMTGVSISPDERFVAGPTQDREVHIWDLVTDKDYRLGGYQRKVGAIGWTRDAPFLYSTGADVLVAWALSSDPGTIPPVEIGYAFEQTISAVLPQCDSTIMPAGYTDGSIIVGETTKGTAKIVRPANGGAVTALAEAPDGSFVFGTAQGQVGVFRLQVS